MPGAEVREFPQGTDPRLGLRVALLAALVRLRVGVEDDSPVHQSDVLNNPAVGRCLAGTRLGTTIDKNGRFADGETVGDFISAVIVGVTAVAAHVTPLDPAGVGGVQ